MPTATPRPTKAEKEAYDTQGIESSFRFLRLLGQIFDLQQRAADTVTELRGRVDAVREKVKGADAKKMVVVFPGMSMMNENGLPAVMTGGIYDDVIRAAGGVSAFAGQSSDATRTINAEQLAAAKVDVLVVGAFTPKEKPAEDAARILKQFPHWEAAKNRHVRDRRRRRLPRPAERLCGGEDRQGRAPGQVLTVTGHQAVLPRVAWRPGLLGSCLVLVVALVAAMTASICLGTVTVPLAEVRSVIGYHLAGGAEPSSLSDQIIWTIRVPRVLLASVVGAALSIAGVALQALVRNPLADPYVLGVSSGASLGAVLVMGAGLAGVTTTAGAFAGATTTLLTVFVLAQRSGRLTDSRLVLAGVAVSYLAMAGTSLLQLRAEPTQVRGILFWLMGSVAGADWSKLGLPAAVMAVAAGYLVLQGRALNALAVGDDDAAALGVDVHRLRIILLLASSLLTATAVAVAGGVGFVGLMVPHAARLVVGSDHRKLLPVATLAGAVFLVLVDLATRTVDRPNEYPITVFTAALGAPFFLWLLRTARGGAG